MRTLTLRTPLRSGQRLAGSPVGQVRPQRKRRALRVEQLEDRDVPSGFSTFLGGSLGDYGRAIAVDAAGNTYLVGSTQSADMPVSFGTFHGGSDLFVAKLGPDGGLLWASMYGGSNSDWSDSAPALDGSGNVYIAGNTSSADFPTTAGAYQQTYNGDSGNAFVMKLDGTSGAMLYSTYLSGSTLTEGNAIAVDAAGNAYVSGFTSSTDFPATASAFQTSSGGGRDAFVAKLNPAGSALVYATYLGGGGDDYVDGIAVDAAGNAYVTGETDSTNFPTTPGAFDSTANGNVDAFVAKLDPAGAALIYSTYLGGGDSEDLSRIAIDNSGNAYVTGDTYSANFPTTAGAFDTTPGGGADTFIAKLDTTGSALVYSTLLGGSGGDYGKALAVDVSGNAYIVGYTNSTGFPTTPDAVSTSSNGGIDTFITKLNAAGAALVYSTYLGGSANEFGGGIAIDPAGNVYVTGSTASADFPVSAGAFQATYGGGDFDAFVTKLAIGGTIGPSVTIDQAVGQDDPTSVSPIVFAVQFNEPVNGFAADDIVLSGTLGGTAAASVVSVVPGTAANSYVVTVAVTGSHNGTVIASIPAGAVTNLLGNDNSASTSTDDSVTFDNVPPTVSVNRADGQADPTKASPVQFIVQFSEPVDGFGAGDVLLSGTATGTTVVSVDPGTVANSYVVTVAVPGTQAGTVIASVPADKVTDPAGNPNTASNGDSTVTFDNVPPSVTITPNPAGTVGGTSVTFDVLFSEAVVGFDATKVDLTGTTAPGATVAVNGTGPGYTVTVSGMTGGGTITAQIDAGVVTNLATNPNLASGSASVTYVHSGTVQFSAPTFTINEQGAPTLTVHATRLGGSEGSLSVNYATGGGTAVAGTDYTAASGTLTWAAGVTTDQTFTVPIIDDGVLDGDKTVGLTLSGISLPGALGTPSTATVNILETAGLSFSAANYNVNVTDGTATITVKRLFDSTGAVSVHYATSDGTAISTGAVPKYTPTSGTLNWPDGNTSDMTFSVPISAVTLSEGNEKVNLTLSAATGNAEYGPKVTATVIITKHNGMTINGTDKKPQSTFTDTTGDLVTLKLGGKVGTMTYYLTDGKEPISEIDLSGTDSSKSTVSISVAKPKGATGNGRTQIDEIDGTGVKSLSLSKADLIGAGIDLTSFLGSLTIGHVENGADITLAGTPPATPKNLATKITAGVIDDGTDISITGAPLGSLTATRIGVGSITAPSVGTINVKGKPKTKTTQAISGDFKSSLTIAGTGLPPKTPALKSLKVAGTVSGSTIRVGGLAGTVGDIGSVSVGSFVNSKLFAGYTGPTDGTGSFNLPSTIGTFAVKGAANAFSKSFVIASNFKNVTLASADTNNGGNKFGFVFHTTFGGLTLKNPKAIYNKTTGGTQVISGDLEVLKV